MPRKKHSPDEVIRKLRQVDHRALSVAMNWDLGQLRYCTLCAILALALLAFASCSRTPEPLLAKSTDARELLSATERKADALLARSDLTDYRGWIKYLRFLSERDVARTSSTGDVFTTNILRLADWVQRIENNPRVLSTLRGPQEWAYESAADESGQPFRINIPTDYDPAHPAGMIVNLHYGHSDYMQGWMGKKKGMFELTVMGRARGAGYWGLAEADVLDAMRYVQNHWRIDENRIHLAGTSMGGFGVSWIAARHPHLFASGAIHSGGATLLPPNNLLTFPMYSIHSRDDWAAPILNTSVPFARITEMGGQAILDSCDGMGHNIWPFEAGRAREKAWQDRQVRPDSRTLRHLDFTAVGDSTRCWWAEVAEWGPKTHLYPHFVLSAAPDNTLYASLTNIARLRLRISESPLDRRHPMHVVINSAAPLEIPAPLPDSLVLVSGPQNWTVENQPESLPFRLHAPNVAGQMYDGSPLLIVYGTGGPAELRDAITSAAREASKSPNPGWAFDGRTTQAADGVWSHQNVYGNLNVKADRDVTDADLQKNLVLLGTAEQNRVVATLAAQLPVRISGGKIICNDGVEYDETSRALVLTHYNPLAPQRAILWIASNNSAAFTEKSNRLIRTDADLVIFDPRVSGFRCDPQV